MTSATSAIGSNKSTNASGASSTGNAQFNLTPSDFLNLMITQLQHQDPTQPTDSSQILSQMSQIGSLQASDSLQTSLAQFGLQTSISSASSMIGKTVKGLDANSKPQTGIVNSVSVANNAVSLQLDTGVSLPLANVTSIAPAPTGTTAAGPTISG